MPDKSAPPSSAGEASSRKKNARQSTRRRARQRAVELIFETDAKNISYHDLLQEYDLINSANNSMRSVPDYSRVLLQTIAENQAYIDQVINANLQDWELHRLPAVDRAILRLGVAEMLFAPDVPIATVIDESVSLAGQLSTDNSPNFINGILGYIQPMAEDMRCHSKTDERETINLIEAEKKI